MTPPAWRRRAPATHDRRVRHLVPIGAVVVTLALGTVACSGGDTQGRREPELRELDAKVAQLRLEVQSLRLQVKALQEQLVTGETATGTPTGTTAPGASR